MPELLDAVPPDALECVFLEAEEHEDLPHGWVHIRTLPYTIVAQALTGRYEVRAGRDSVTARAGEAFLVGANRESAVAHLGDPRRGMKMAARWLHAHWTLFGTLDVMSLLALPLKLDARRAEPFGAIIAELLAPRASALVRAARRSELAFRALGLIAELAPLRPEAAGLLAVSDRLAPVTAFVRAHLAEPFSVESLAKAAFLSSSRLHVVFRERLGMSPMAYVREVRLSEARRLLVATARPIGEVAAATGFANQFNFSRAFRRAVGQTPSAYRRAQAGPEA
jgi:AraC-like DNA-binding protein